MKKRLKIGDFAEASLLHKEQEGVEKKFRECEKTFSFEQCKAEPGCH